MNRASGFRRSAPLALAVLAFLGCLAAVAYLLGLWRPQHGEAKRPNIVLLVSDDQRLDDMWVLSKTRALLGQPGTTFTNAYVSTPLCCPSRATLLTGQYAHNNGVLDNGPPLGGYGRLDHTNTLAVWLQKAGYYTAHLGKYLNSYGVTSPPVVPPGWSRWFGLVDPSTYQMYGYTVSDNGRLVTYGKAPEDYQTDVLARKAEEVIRHHPRKDSAGKERPFFLTVAPLAPHLEGSDGAGAGGVLRPAPRHLRRFVRVRPPAKDSFNEADVRTKPAYIQARRPITGKRRKEINRIYRARLASLLALDDLVERVVKALRETGQLDNTVLLFLSDNGFFLGEHRLPEGKYYPYEEAIHVPLLIRGGGFPAGATARQVVGNIDIAPTILALAGATAGRAVDGLPLLPLARDPHLENDRALLIEGFSHGRRAQLGYTGVRTGRWVYIEYETGERELYDLEADPHELANRAAAPELASLRATLAARLARLRRCSGATCR
jgi:N-acetylglucosamine-6-sulfatase